MALYLDYITKPLRVRLEAWRDDRKRNIDPTFFKPTGTQVYCGRQGSGKTISAVHHLLRIKKDYPQAIIVSNLDLMTYNQVLFEDIEELKLEMKQFNPEKDYIYFVDMSQLEIALTQVNNGFKGVVYLIDEIHTYFNALDSKNIPPYVFTEISQQRKQRKLIVGTSQLFLRMAKPFREQCDNMINCFTWFGFITFQVAYDGMTLTQDFNGKLQGNRRKFGWFFHRLTDRNAFDTYQKVVSGAVQYETISKLSINAKGKRGKKIEISE